MDISRMDARPTWFQVITRPRTRLLATIVVIVVFITGIALGTYISEYSLWFYFPAVGTMLWWYLAMMSRYRKARRAG